MIRVLLVDDSAVVRSTFTRELSHAPDMRVVGEAPDPFVARDLILALKPDVVVLDIEMPRMDGLTFLRKLMKHYPTRVVVCSSLSVRGGEVALDAMRSGACAVVCKPGPTQSPATTAAELIEAIRNAAAAYPSGIQRAATAAVRRSPLPISSTPPSSAKPSSWRASLPVRTSVAPPVVRASAVPAAPWRSSPPPARISAPPSSVAYRSSTPPTRLSHPPPLPRDGVFRGDANQLVAIGASTGGTVAIEHILALLPQGLPPVVIAQHMPAYITKPFAARLNTLGRLEVREAVDGDELVSGLVLVAPGGLHFVVEARGSRLFARVKDGPLVSGHRPSVDVLFRSVAQACRARAVGVILTGMGSDGAKGLALMHDAGARTFAQDEATSVVFGMPRVAIEVGAVDEVRGLPQIAAAVVNSLAKGPKLRSRQAAS